MANFLFCCLAKALWERVTTIYWDLYIIKWINCANHFKYRSTRLLPGWDFISSSCLQRSCWPQTHYSYRQSDDVTYLFLLPLVGSSVPQISFDVTEKVLLGKHLIIAVISVIIVDLLLYLSISFLIIIAENSLRTKLVVGRVGFVGQMVCTAVTHVFYSPLSKNRFTCTLHLK